MALMNSQKKQKSYRTQFTGAQLLGLVSLVGLSLLISFYLGVITGKSFRPDAEVTLSSQTAKQKTTPSKPLTPEELEFFNSLDPKDQQQKTSFNTNQIEKLRKKTESLQKQQPAKTTPPPAKETAITTQTSQTPSLPITKPTKPPAPPPVVTVKTAGIYTLQVFTSSNKQRAETLVKRLKESGYLEAYLNPYVTEDKQTLYRVRVGKTNKDSAESLANKLKQLDFIETVQITRL